MSGIERDKLTTPQRVALIALEAAALSYPGSFIDAYTLRATVATLDALVRKGFAERKTDMLGSLFSPRTANRYRLSKVALAALENGNG